MANVNETCVCEFETTITLFICDLAWENESNIYN